MKHFIISGMMAVLSSSPYQSVNASTDFSPHSIFNEDDRQEVYLVSPAWQQLAQAVAGKVELEHIQGNQLIGVPLNRRVCPANRFADQITVPSCTGFLVKQNLLITAGHCMKTPDDCARFAWVFGYALKNQQDQNYTSVSQNQIYRCQKVVSRRLEDFGAVDYAIIELDRPVEGRPTLKLGINAELTPGMQVAALGHPSGLPMKFVDHATIISLTDNGRTINTDLDIFQGNSGSPIFDASTGSVIGIASHWQADHIRDPEKLCKIPKVCKPGDQCYWSASSRVSSLKEEPSLAELTELKH